MVSCQNEKGSNTLSDQVLKTVAYNLQAINGYVYKSDRLVASNIRYCKKIKRLSFRLHKD